MTPPTIVCFDAEALVIPRITEERIDLVETIVQPRVAITTQIDDGIRAVTFLDHRLVILVPTTVDLFYSMVDEHR